MSTTDNQKNKGPMAAIIAIVVLFILGYLIYTMFIPKQVENMNQTEKIEVVK